MGNFFCFLLPLPKDLTHFSLLFMRNWMLRASLPAHLLSDGSSDLSLHRQITDMNILIRMPLLFMIHINITVFYLFNMK